MRHGAGAGPDRPRNGDHVKTLDCVVVGAGQAGLGVSYFLQRDRREHVVLEQGRIGETWLSQRWDSFKLNTPNFMSVLPGLPYDGPEPDGFLQRDELVQLPPAIRGSIPIAGPNRGQRHLRGAGRRQGAIHRHGESRWKRGGVHRELAPLSSPAAASGRRSLPRCVRGFPPRSPSSIRPTTATRGLCRPARSWSSEAASRAARSPRICWLPAGPCTCARAGSAVFPAATGDATCWSGGWT